MSRICYLQRNIQLQKVLFFGQLVIQNHGKYSTNFLVYVKFYVDSTRFTYVHTVRRATRVAFEQYSEGRAQKVQLRLQPHTVALWGLRVKAGCAGNLKCKQFRSQNCYQAHKTSRKPLSLKYENLLKVKLLSAVLGWGALQSSCLSASCSV